jgi:aryl-alcohol dehydrogenase-like predicted oxidoreductase
MLDLEELRPIGFGAYRVDDRSGVHGAALHDALDAGCNLIDTASNYCDGHSEALIGKVLAQRGDVDAFVITKAGYISPTLHREFRSAGVSAEADNHDGQSTYRIDPDALRVSLDVSRRRLGRSCLDGVLVHNPEILLEHGSTPVDVYAQLERTFCFLDDEVDRGGLRYYGISSNFGLDLDLIATAAARSSHDNHFRFAQFPLNLLERDAAEGSPSLIERAHRLGLRAISNRPLNALLGGSPVRLAYYRSAEPNSTDTIFGHCVEAVSGRLREIQSDATWSDFAPLKFLRDNREGIPDPELVDAIWTNQVLPFVAKLFGDALTEEIVALFDQLRRLTRACSLAALAATTQRALAGLADHPPGGEPAAESLAEAACRYCLSAGVDHVLVGMRHPAYVASLTALLQSPRVPDAQHALA